ncbi:hypothetical protein BDV28DRAFT_158984 [Aspergillus coremiiformis]|uniref:Uncharacterized protein n=1 Tax=Aspergillus coremiiformis TaxID=138285 RepID=A0A5N6Z376_9EURO|nr:hypothetical protein BDV28DRAFT_158984 [Aspergillus coremiiformis]
MASTLPRLATQSIYITTKPILQSLTESKQILTALQKFGEVVTFRNLKYDTTNNSENASSRSIVAIFESPAAASQAIASSPLIIPLQSQSQSQSQPQPKKPSSDPWASTEAAQNAARTHLTCTIQPSRHNHESALRRNPFHTVFRVSEKSYQSQDLVRTGIPLKELADVPMARKSHEPLRVKRRIQEENERFGATSLVGLYEAGLGEKRSEVEGKEVD